MSSATMKVDRREFLKGAAAGATGLVIGFYLPNRPEARGGCGGAICTKRVDPDRDGQYGHAGD
jgi:hypothetical protein